MLLLPSALLLLLLLLLAPTWRGSGDWAHTHCSRGLYYTL
jgi:hypothetical protein